VLPKLPKASSPSITSPRSAWPKPRAIFLFDFFTSIVLTEVSCDEVVIDCLVEELVRVGNATGLDLFRYALFDLGLQSNLQDSLLRPYFLPTGIASPRFIDPPPSLT
jgi:hypothetical protein